MVQYNNGAAGYNGSIKEIEGQKGTAQFIGLYAIWHETIQLDYSNVTPSRNIAQYRKVGANVYIA